MPLYQYKAYDKNGAMAGGVIDAASSELAFEKVKNLKLFPVSISEERPSQGFSLFSERRDEILFSLTQLASLVKAGLPLAKALESISAHLENDKLKKSYSRLKVRLEEGLSLSSAMQEDRIFPVLLVKMVQAGETAGALESSIEKFAEFTEREENFVKKVMSSLMYPVIVVIASILLITFMLVYIAPVLVDIFSKLKKNLPLSTKVLFIMGDFLRNNYVYIIVIIVLLFIIYFKFIPRDVKDKLKLKIPFFGWISRNIIFSRWSSTLSTLHSAGVTILVALENSADVVTNSYARSVLRKIRNKVEKGLTLSEALRSEVFFPPLMSQLAETGEKTGELSKMLDELSLFYEKEISRRLNIFIQLLEPSVILILGLAIGFIVVSILLPIFEINKFIK